MGTPASKEIEVVRRFFDGQQLRLARELRGFSQQHLGSLAGGLSGAAISQFEQGAAKPRTRTLAELATALRFPIQFFASHANRSWLDPPASFRSLRSTSSRERQQARAFVELVHQFVSAIEKRIELPTVDIPDHPVSPTTEPDEIEQIAAQVRREWTIAADKPIANMIEILERHGVIAARVEFENQRMDAFSVPFTTHPIVVFCADKGKRDRSRFDAAHELGHLVMHRTINEGSPVIEKQAHSFASAFLTPAESVVSDLPHHPEWDVLLAAKRKWGTSIAQLLYRARTLEHMKEEDYIRATKMMSAQGWRRDEPGDLGAPESPSVLRNAVALLQRDGFTLQEIADEAALPMDQVNRILDAMAPTRPKVLI